MKACIAKSFTEIVLGIATLVLEASAQAAAFGFFGDISPNSSGIYTNLEGISPTSLIAAGDTLYGTARLGGTGETRRGQG
jgi:hypothetical protein